MYDKPPKIEDDGSNEENSELSKQVYESPTQEQVERLEQWKIDHPKESIPFELRRDNFEKEIEQVNKLIEDFEQKHDLAKLHEIVELTPRLLELFKNDRSMSQEDLDTYLVKSSPEEVEKYIRRRDAKNDLIAITDVFLVMQNETKITLDELNECKLPYKRLSKAVGMITANSNQIDHTR